MSRLALPGLLVVIVFLAVSGAGILAWTLGLAAILLAATLCGTVILHRPAQTEGPPRFIRWDTVGAALVLLVLLSALPLPPPLDRLAGARRTEQNGHVTRALAAAHSQSILSESDTGGFALSRNRAGTLRMVLLLVASLGALGLSAALGPKAGPALLRILHALAAGLALCGLTSLLCFPQGDTLLWFIPIEHSLPGPVACFVNRNHFAGFLALLIPSVFVSIPEDFRLRRWGALLFSATCAIAMGMGVAASLSRGAILAGAAGLLVTAGLLVWKRRPLPAASLAAFVGVFAIAVGLLPSPSLRDELRTLVDPSETPSFQTRAAAWRDTLATWRSYPILGAGLNALRTTYPQHRRTASRGYLTHAENEYLQLLAEGGLLGFSGFALFLLLLARSIHPALIGPPEPGGLPILTGVPGAAAVAAAHALLDFPLRLPLYAVTLSALLGLLLSTTRAKAQAKACAPAHAPAHAPDTADADLLDSSSPSFGTARTPSSGVAFLLLLAAAFLSPWMGDIARLDSPPALKNATAQDLARALTWSPTCPRAWYYFGRLACAINTPETCRLGEESLARSVACDPNSHPIWNQLGWLRLKLGDIPGAREAFEQVRRIRPWVKTPSLPPEARP